MKKIYILLSLILIISIFITPITSHAEDTDTLAVEVKSEAALLYSIDTGDILYTKSADEKRYPASLTKLLTAVVVLEHADNIDSQVTVDSSVFEELSGTGLTVAELNDGEKLSIRQLLSVMLISSAADAANVLAHHIGGSVDNFVTMMNETAKKLGMNSSHFTNTTGMHDKNHYSTANDLLKLAKHIVEMPVISEICDTTAYMLPSYNNSGTRKFITTNLMLNEGSGYYYKYAHGLKTGFTTPAGRCLISTASYEGYHYICIILGGDRDLRTEFTDSRNLYRWAFLGFEYQKIADTNDMIAEEMAVELAWDTDQVQMYPEKAVYAIIPKGSDITAIRNTPQFYSNYGSKINAPVKKGQILGYAVYSCGNQQFKVNVVAGEDIERSWVLYLQHIALSIVGSKPFIIICGAIFVLLISAIIVNSIHNKRKRERIKRINRIRRY